MTRLDAWNAIAAILALSISLVAVLLAGGPRPSGSIGPTSGESARWIEDATGTRVELRRFDRIASASTIADDLLIELCEPDRVIAFTSYSQKSSPRAHRYAGKRAIDDLSELEAILELSPDLLLVSNVADRRRVERLREAGIVVFDLGPMHGLATLPKNVVDVAKLIGEERRGAALLETWLRRLRRVAGHIPEAARYEAIYLSIYGTSLYGGTRNTSYGDILQLAGLEDIAAKEYKDWPSYTAERVLLFDPPVIVTNDGMGASICNHPGLSALQACAEGTTVEVDAELLGDPGLGMLEAAEAVHERVYGTAGPLVGRAQ